MSWRIPDRGTVGGESVCPFLLSVGEFPMFGGSGRVLGTGIVVAGMAYGAHDDDMSMILWAVGGDRPLEMR
jgi:hypothetical protein